SLARTEQVVRLGQRRFDVVVIGGGITGAGIAREAAQRGLDVALVERDDFASGTSSRSSRLVHGGVRYLEHGHLRLVFEACHERRLLLNIAPHLVHPLRFTWPVYAGSRIPRWKLRAGLLVYDVLALFRNVAPHRGLSARALAEAEPQLERQALTGGAQYFDAATDDARLTLATVLDAARAGATVLNHAEVSGLMWTDGRVSGVHVTDRLGGRTFDVEAACVVSAAGPWTDSIRKLEDPGAAPAVLGSKGAHIAVPAERVGNRGAVTLLAPDGRVMFVLPAGSCSVIGTTETDGTVSPDAARATRADVDYLLASANRAFPEAKLTTDDVIAAWAGIRPLAAIAHRGDANSASREHLVATGPGGVITVTGGKLTTYRVIAEDTVRAVLRALHRRAPRSAPDRAPLAGGDIGDLDAAIETARGRTEAVDIAQRLVYAYGSAWTRVWARVERDDALARRLVADLPYIEAEVVHAVEDEYACTLADVLVRRVHVAFETRDHGRGVAPRVAALMAPSLGWTDRGVALALAEFDAAIARIFSVDD
ncbi:MAG: glycerol-3-phosphate dehydrogenase/oxidase, partial [Gemmatimonadaceae bacterium]|nr:glycerol-3-phosphate dehydrogenase/oxidase [Gemmatimonadaceae bacterium]